MCDEQLADMCGDVGQQRHRARTAVSVLRRTTWGPEGPVFLKSPLYPH
jgi:hypothetical protein